MDIVFAFAQMFCHTVCGDTISDLFTVWSGTHEFLLALRLFFFRPHLCVVTRPNDVLTIQ